MRYLLFILSVAISFNCFAIKQDSLKKHNKSIPQEYVIRGATFSYSRPKPFSFIKNIPKDLYGLGKSTLKKESILPISATIAATAITFYYDDKLARGSQNISTKIGISNENDFFNASKMSMFKGEKNVKLPLFLPQDIPTGIYFLGDGMTSMLLSAGFFGFGLIKKDNRALTTSQEITGMLISMGIVTQSIKRITGRPSPVVSTSPRGGRWQFFPGPLEYSQRTPYYDAFPSGHVATAMATLTIIGENYAEYHWIKPVGYTLVGLMGFQMAHTKVHWVSDYPLAVLIGYVMGNNAVKRGRTEIKKEANVWEEKPTPFWKKIQVNPYLGNTKGVALSYTF